MTQHNVHTHQAAKLSACTERSHAQRLVRAPVVVYPVAYNPARVLQGLEAVAMRALLLEGAHHALDHAVI
ncbi:hypothetical protein B0O95_11633 [Mycetohabitans endofungorum]|uniref:Uncharacterized protein n=1 Tax=Mycetohabitans endofungorum TaxID=417203 RepID=A0A2P5K7D2_9BURK|nr:hypothetical protein B0O95_11633 [Mycetohabitans endofungorum]